LTYGAGQRTVRRPRAITQEPLVRVVDDDGNGWQPSRFATDSGDMDGLVDARDGRRVVDLLQRRRTFHDGVQHEPLIARRPHASSCSAATRPTSRPVRTPHAAIQDSTRWPSAGAPPGVDRPSQGGGLQSSLARLRTMIRAPRTMRRRRGREALEPRLTAAYRPRVQPAAPNLPSRRRQQQLRRIRPGRRDQVCTRQRRRAGGSPSLRRRS
jgi:hypothetical protein